MNITRTKKNQYYNKKKRSIIKEKNILSRIKNLKIPPAYHNVLISSDPNSKIQATGYDDLNRKQYIYHSKFLEQQKEIKFSDLIKFGKKIKRIRKDINKNISKFENLLNKDKVISIMLYLMDKCNFRVGSEKYRKKYNTYGVTTLNVKHLTFKPKHLEIRFIGKKNVMNVSSITNEHAILYLKFLCTINKDNEYIFYYKNDKLNEAFHINEKHINKYLQKYDKFLTAKMFRTWTANHLLIKLLLEEEIPKSDSIAKKHINKILGKIAFKLHHTKDVSKKSYVNNKIVQLYLTNFNLFYKIINNSKKSNGELPTIDRLLNIFLEYLAKT